MPDVDELKARLRKIRLHQFKLPMMAKSFFNADLNNLVFYRQQSRLALLNRVGKDVLKYKKPLSAEDAKKFLDFEEKYYWHYDFLEDNVHYVDTIGYQLNPDVQIKLKYPYTSQNSGSSGTSGSVVFPTLREIEDILDSPYLDATILQQFQIEYILFVLEACIVDDNSFYRVLSLSAVFNPELFSDNFLKVHFDFICNYYKVKSLSLSNMQSVIFSNNILTKDAIFNWLGRPSSELEIYNIYAEGDDYVIYFTKNLLSVGKSVNIIKLTLKEFMAQNYGEMGRIRIDMVFNLASFYEFSLKLQNNTTAQKTSLENMEKLSILQKESYMNFISDIGLLLGYNN
jgi:hypothetical protein